jgi:serine/threonine-protein kinase
MAVSDTGRPTENGVATAPQTIKGRYRVVAATSPNAEATVYSAQDITNGRLVTVEVLRGEFAADADFVAAVRDQAYRLAKPECAHRALMRVHECDVTETGEVYVVLDHVEGRSLREIIEERGALDMHEALRIAIQVGEALETLHHSGIVHGELRPESILIVKAEDGTESVKLVGVELTSAHRTAIAARPPDESVAPYLAPEQLDGGAATEASDVHALGLVIQELLTAERPSSGPARRRDLPSSVVRILDRALDPRPEERYSNLSVMLNDLWTAQSQPQTEAAASRVSSRRSQMLSAPRPRVRVIVGAVAAVVVIAATGWIVFFDQPTPVRTAVPERPALTTPTPATPPSQQVVTPPAGGPRETTPGPGAPPPAAPRVTAPAPVASTPAPAAPSGPVASTPTPAPPAVAPRVTPPAAVAPSPVEPARTPTPPPAVAVVPPAPKAVTREPAAVRPSAPSSRTSPLPAAAPDRSPAALVPERKVAAPPPEVAPRSRRSESRDTESAATRVEERGSEGDGSAIIDWLLKDR